MLANNLYNYNLISTNLNLDTSTSQIIIIIINDHQELSEPTGHSCLFNLPKCGVNLKNKK